MKRVKVKTTDAEQQACPWKTLFILISENRQRQWTCWATTGRPSPTAFSTILFNPFYCAADADCRSQTGAINASITHYIHHINDKNIIFIYVCVICVLHIGISLSICNNNTIASYKVLTSDHKSGVFGRPHILLFDT